MFFDKQLLEKTIKRAEKDGLRVSTRKLLRDLGITAISKKGDLPATGPLLIISNHVGVFDSLLLCSEINREDFYFTALSTYAVFGKKVRERLLPIYRARRLNHRIFEYPLCLQLKIKLPENLNREEIKSRNRQTINRAAELINQGRAVSIFPGGDVGRSISNSGWKAGVGHLIKQITEPRTKVVFVRITGTRKSDLIAYLRPFLRRLFFRPQPIAITFSKPQLLNKLADLGDNPKEITRKLESLYHDFFVGEEEDMFKIIPAAGTGEDFK